MYLTNEQVQKAFGKFTFTDNRDGSIKPDPEWRRENIITVNMPIVGLVTCHKKIAKPLTAVFIKIEQSGDHYLINISDYKEQGGCYVPRHMYWNLNKGLSRHSWGIAIDLNVNTNPAGKECTDDRQYELNAYFEEQGFYWGNDFSTPDPMHFEASSDMTGLGLLSDN